MNDDPAMSLENQDLSVLLMEYKELSAEKRVFVQALLAAAGLLAAGLAALLTQMQADKPAVVIGFGPLIIYGTWLICGLLGNLEAIQEGLVEAEDRINRIGRGRMTWQRTRVRLIPHAVGIVASSLLATGGVLFGAIAAYIGFGAIASGRALAGFAEAVPASFAYCIFNAVGAAGTLTLFALHGSSRRRSAVTPIDPT